MRPSYQRGPVTLYTGDARQVLAELPADSVQTVVTSPPYYRLRDYGVPGQLGQERTAQEYVDALVATLEELRRVLKPDGTLWLNLGDSYAGKAAGCGRGEGGTGFSRGGKIPHRSGAGPKRGTALKEKDLIGIPWRVAFALQAAGWWLRSEIVWHKTTALPEGSVRDRPHRNHETLFLLSRSARYFYDREAVRQPGRNPYDIARQGTPRKRRKVAPREYAAGGGKVSQTYVGRGDGLAELRTVWSLASSKYCGTHFATFPGRLVDRCIRAGSRPDDLVLDPFSGSGSTGACALALGRRYAGVEISPLYQAEAAARLFALLPHEEAAVYA